MIKRSNPLNITVDANYATVDIGTGESSRQVFIRKPMSSEAAELIRWSFDTERSATVEIGKRFDECDEDDNGKKFAIIRDSQAYIEAMRGRLIGSVWSDPEYDLEANTAQHATPELYGVAVYKELFDARWNPGEIDALHTAVMEMLIQLGNNRYNGAKVEHVLNFGRPPQEPSTSHMST